MVIIEEDGSLPPEGVNEAAVHALSVESASGAAVLHVQHNKLCSTTVAHRLF